MKADRVMLVRLRQMSGPSLRGFCKAWIAQQHTAEEQAPRPCPDYLAFLREARERVESFADFDSLMSDPMAVLMGLQDE